MPAAIRGLGHQCAYPLHIIHEQHLGGLPPLLGNTPARGKDQSSWHIALLQARDAFFACVEASGEAFLLGGPHPPQCRVQRKVFEESCKASWVSAALRSTEQQLGHLLSCARELSAGWSPELPFLQHVRLTWQPAVGRPAKDSLLPPFLRPLCCR